MSRAIEHNQKQLNDAEKVLDFQNEVKTENKSESDSIEFNIDVLDSSYSFGEPRVG
jgi:hypothetical protein